jgi:hypothetical protein
MHRDGGERLAFTIAIGLLLAGCASDAPPTGSRQAQEFRQDRQLQMQPLPAAEFLSQDLRMVPVARDGRGCVQYRLESEARPGLNALFYRTVAGDFSTIKEEASCT